MITYKQKDKYTIHVTVPYKLKDEFKREFPDAFWKPEDKVWRLFANAVVMERLDQFITTTQRPARKAAQLESIEYSYAEIKALELRSDALDRELTDLLEKEQDYDHVIDLLEQAKSKFGQQISLHRTLVARNKEKLAEIKRHIDTLIEDLDVSNDIRTMISAWKSYNGSLRYVGDAEIRAEFMEAQASLKESYHELLEHRGISLTTLLDLAAINWDDRSGPQPQIVARELYRKIALSQAAA